MSAALAVALGGAFGALARYGAGALIARLIGGTFPWATLSVNVLGSFALGLLAPLALSRGLSPELRLLLTTGFMGAFTTFSTFSLETLQLARAGGVILPLGNALLNLCLGLAACYAGLRLAQAWS